MAKTAVVPSGATLTGPVTVTDDQGRQYTFGPSDTVPSWAKPKILNPGAWSQPIAVVDDDGVLRRPALLGDYSADRSDGAHPTVSRSGHAWTVSGSRPAVIRGGRWRFPAAGSTGASYSLLAVAGTPTDFTVRVGFRRYSANDVTNGSNVTFGPWASVAAIGVESPCHLSIGANYWRYSVWKSSVETVVASGDLSLPLDDSLSEVRVVLHRSSGAADLYLPGYKMPQRVTHPLISALTAPAMAWELYRPSVPSPEPSFDFPEVAAMAATGYPTPYTRGLSATASGPLWDPGLGMLVAPTSSGWVKASDGSRVGNLLTPQAAYLADGTTTGFTPTACTLAHDLTAVSPPNHPGSLRLTATGSVPYVTGPKAAVTAGQSYSAQVWRRAATTSRSGFAQIAWYDAGGAAVGSNTVGGAAASSTAWGPGAVVTGTAPAGATQAAIIYVAGSGVAAGEQHYVSLMTLAAGTITGYIEP